MSNGNYATPSSLSPPLFPLSPTIQRHGVCSGIELVTLESHKCQRMLMLLYDYYTIIYLYWHVHELSTECYQGHLIIHIVKFKISYLNIQMLSMLIQHCSCFIIKCREINRIEIHLFLVLSICS